MSSIEPVTLRPETVETVRGIATRQAIEAAERWRAEQLHDVNRRAMLDFLGAELAPRHQIPRAVRPPSGRPGVITTVILGIVALLTLALVAWLTVGGYYLWMTR